MIEETQVVPADALPRSWVENAPVAWQPYLRLARLDRPIGTWLLFWPCFFGLALGAAGQNHAFLSTPRDWLLLCLFVLRVLGQMLVAFRRVSFLPPMEQWQSGLVPYHVLLAMQCASAWIVAIRWALSSCPARLPGCASSDALYAWIDCWCWFIFS